MNNFAYASPGSLEEAVKLLSDTWGKTEILAGGTDLVTSLKQNLTAPELVVSLKNIKGLKGIRSEGGVLRIGAATTLRELIDNPDAQQHFPALTAAATGIAAPQMLNVGTVGGELLQRPRCWYYRQGYGLFGTLDGKSLVLDGDNRYHAIFGNNGPAKYVHPSSLAPALDALGASVTVVGPSGERSIKVSALFQTPSKDTDRESTLKPNEILTEIVVPMSGLKNATYEVRHRVGLDWPMVTASVAFNASEGRVVLGHVAPVPWHAEAASKALNAAVANEEGAAKVAAAAVQGASPLSRNAYKVQQVKAAVRRAILAAAG